MKTQVGIIGAGQLGRMMALAGYPLGLSVCFVDSSADSPGAQVGDIILGELTDHARLAELADAVDVVTFDVENLSPEHIEDLARRRPFRPPPSALLTAQDRLNEKNLFTEMGIPTPRFMAVDSRADLSRAADHVGLPLVLKTRRLGYDGRGQTVIRTVSELDAGFERLGGVPLIAEAMIDFDCEVSAIAVRSSRGQIAHYPLSLNVHADGVLRFTTAPHDDADLAAHANAIAEKMLERFEYVGVLTIEFFVKDGQLMANEIAPRVHNSGHWTIEGATTSQFENHIRAVADLPLGRTDARGFCAMVNFLGTMPSASDVLAIDGAHLHDYGKAPRPGRKLGHASACAPTAAERDRVLNALRELAAD